MAVRLSVQPVRTDPSHLAGTIDPGMQTRSKPETTARTADKNGVRLEEQLMKVADTETLHSTVTAIFKSYMTHVQHRAWQGILSMAADLGTSLQVSAAGMDVQVARIKIIAENLANQNTTGSSPGADAYRRRTITFQNKLDKALGVETVSVKSVGTDKSAEPLRYDPDNPAANKDGYVKTPNVNSFVELMDMRDAEQSYSANLNVASTTRTMLNRTLDLIK